jgi:hypothetical protein
MRMGVKNRLPFTLASIELKLELAVGFRCCHLAN